MIKLENLVLASPEQMSFIIQGLRNPMNSWEKSDSQVCNYMFKGRCGSCEKENNGCRTDSEENDFYMGINDYTLMQRLAKSGTDDRKFSISFTRTNEFHHTRFKKSDKFVGEE